jgi:hypothetical protein
MARVDIDPGFFRTIQMINKIFCAFICTFSLILLTVGGLGLMLGIGPVFMSASMAVIGGFGLVFFSSLIGE